MNSKKLDPFQFSKSLDNKFLNEFFDGDMEYASAVFEEFLTNISQFWNEVEQAADAADPVALKSAIHKTKTLFGYVGHSSISATLDSFEDQCSRAKSMAELRIAYDLMVEEKIAAIELIAEECTRLREYLSPHYITK